MNTLDFDMLNKIIDEETDPKRIEAWKNMNDPLHMLDCLFVSHDELPTGHPDYDKWFKFVYDEAYAVYVENIMVTKLPIEQADKKLINRILAKYPNPPKTFKIGENNA